MSSTWLPPMNGSCLMFLGCPQWIGLVSIYLLINERSKDNLQRQIVLKFKKNSSRIAKQHPPSPPQVCLKLNKKISLMASPYHRRNKTYHLLSGYDLSTGSFHSFLGCTGTHTIFQSFNICIIFQTFVKGYLITFVRLLLGIDAEENSGHLSSVSFYYTMKSCYVEWWNIILMYHI